MRHVKNNSRIDKTQRVTRPGKDLNDWSKTKVAEKRFIIDTARLRNAQLTLFMQPNNKSSTKSNYPTRLAFH